MCGIYPLLSILWWNLLAQWMKFVYGRGYSQWWTYQLLPRFSKGAPGWFTCDPRHWASQWDDNLFDCDASNRKCKPNPAFYLHFRDAAKNRYSDWIAKAADNVARPLVTVVSNLLGSLLHGYTTFSNWIESIRNIVGTWKPWWSASLANAAQKLYLWLPSSIRGNTSTWSELWEAIKTAVKDWAKVRFDAAKTWVANTAPWLVAGYNLVRGWYDSVATWVTNFKNDPYGTVASLLGAAWTFLNGAWTELRNFYNNVWVPFKVDLHDFLDHPMLWLYDQVEDYLVKRW